MSQFSHLVRDAAVPDHDSWGEGTYKSHPHWQSLENLQGNSDSSALPAAEVLQAGELTVGLATGTAKSSLASRLCTSRRFCCQPLTATPV